MIIGKFQKHDDGAISGELDALLLGRAKLSLERSEQGADYIVILTETASEVGAAWNRSAKGKSYISVRLDSPFLPAPVNAALFPTRDGGYNLVWNRQKLPGENSAPASSAPSG
jgi:uncharacterized protein (DUF736 family)